MEPTRLGPYRIVGRLGRGGMGTVYEAVDDKTGLEVAVKVLAAHLADDAALRRRFVAEIETLKELVHPSIVRLLAYGEEEGQPYFAMELVRGTSLDHRLRGGERFDWQRCAEVAGTVATALKVAHDHGVIHRDLKPANLLMTDDGAVKLADFGIAKLFGTAGFTAHGSVVGTAEFMAPEQARGEGVDHRADIYALGGVMFAMLTGRPPLKGRSVPEILDKLLREPPPRVSSLVADIPPELDELIDRMLAKDPSQRPATALVTGRLLEAIAESAASEPVEIPCDDGRGTLTGSTATTAEIVMPRSVEGAPDMGGEAIGATLDASRADAGKPSSSREPTASEGKRPADETAATAAFRGPTDDGSGTQAPLTTRFTTVENLERVRAEQAAREASRQTAVGVAAAALLVTVVAVAGYLLLRPPTADELYARIERETASAEGVRDAAPLVERFLASHPDDPRAAGVRAIADRITIESLDRRARSGLRAARSPLERDYRLAIEAGSESPSTGLALLEALRLIYHLEPSATKNIGERGENDAAWPSLVQRQIDRLAPLAEVERTEDLARIAEALAEAERLADDATANPSAAADLRLRRRTLLEAIDRVYANRPHAADRVAEARRLLLATPSAAPPVASKLQEEHP